MKFLIPALVVGVLLMTLGVGLALAKGQVDSVTPAAPAVNDAICPGYSGQCNQPCAPACIGGQDCVCGPDGVCWGQCQTVTAANCPPSVDCPATQGCLKRQAGPAGCCGR